MGNRESIGIKAWACYISIIIIWSLMVLAMIAGLLPEADTFWLSVAMALILTPVSWVLSGISGYWLAVGFDRVTGLGMTLPGNPLARRHFQNQIIIGPTLLIDVLLSIPLTWSFGREAALCVKPIGSSAYGIVISGKPSGSDKGWYQLKFVQGSTSYKEARARKMEAKWFPVSDLEECEAQSLTVLS